MAESQTVTELRKIETAFAKLRNNLKRADLEYTVQVSINSTDPRTVVYACQMTAPANGLMPIRFIANSADALVEKIKASTKHIDLPQVEIAYHEAQILSGTNTIKGHEERIEEIKAELAEESGEEKPTEEQ